MGNPTPKYLLERDRMIMAARMMAASESDEIVERSVLEFDIQVEAKGKNLASEQLYKQSICRDE